MEKKRIESFVVEIDKKRINKFNLGYDGVIELLLVLYVLCWKNILWNFVRLFVFLKILEVFVEKLFFLFIVILFWLDISCRVLFIFIKCL